MESDNIRRLAARFPGIFPASRLPGGSLGDLEQFPGKLAHRAGKSPALRFFATPMIRFYTPNQLIPPMASPYFPLIGYYYA